MENDPIKMQMSLQIVAAKWTPKENTHIASLWQKSRFQGTQKTQIEILDDGFISNSTEALTPVVAITGVKETDVFSPQPILNYLNFNLLIDPVMSTTHILTNVREVETHIGSRSGVEMGGKWKRPHPGELWLLEGLRG